MRWQISAVAIAAVLWAAPAAARSHRDLPWALPQAWTSTIRLLLLDLGYEVTERDRDAGFIRFQFTESESRHSGSVEIIERPLPDGRAGVRVVVTLASLPSYLELHLIDRLERKLRAEVGEPAVPRRARPAAERPPASESAEATPEPEPD